MSRISLLANDRKTLLSHLRFCQQQRKLGHSQSHTVVLVSKTHFYDVPGVRFLKISLLGNLSCVQHCVYAGTVHLVWLSCWHLPDPFSRTLKAFCTSWWCILASATTGWGLVWCVFAAVGLEQRTNTLSGLVLQSSRSDYVTYANILCLVKKNTGGS